MKTSAPSAGWVPRPRWIVAGVAFVSVALFLWSVAVGRTFQFSELLYDLAVGVGAATVLSIVVSLYFRREEELRLQTQRAVDEADRRRVEQERQRARREQKHWEAIEKELDRLQGEVLRLDLDAALGELTVKLGAQALVLHQLHGEVRQILAQVDPTYRHPNADLVDRIMRRMEDAVAAEARGQPTSATTAAGSPHGDLLADVQRMIRDWADQQQ